MKIIGILTGLTIMIFASSYPLWAKDVINLAMTNLPPFQIVDGGLAKDCINIRILRKILKQMNIEINYQVMPFKRCLLSLKNGGADIFMGILRRPEREVYMHYVEPPYKQYSSKAFFLTKGKAHLLRRYEDLYSLRVGVRRGFNYFPKFDTDKKIYKEEANTNEQNLLKLKMGRIEALLITEMTGEYLIAMHGYDFEKAPFKYSQKNPAYLVISRKSPFMERVEEFERILQKIVDEQIYEQTEEAFLAELRKKQNMDN